MHEGRNRHPGIGRPAPGPVLGKHDPLRVLKVKAVQRLWSGRRARRPRSWCRRPRRDHHRAGRHRLSGRTLGGHRGCIGLRMRRGGPLRRHKDEGDGNTGSRPCMKNLPTECAMCRMGDAGLARHGGLRLALSGGSPCSRQPTRRKSGQKAGGDQGVAWISQNVWPRNDAGRLAAERLLEQKQPGAFCGQ